jgi:hypothetical protein
MRTNFLHTAGIFISLFLLTSLSSNGQSGFFSRDRFEFGFGVGPLYFLGDLGGNTGVGSMGLKDVQFSEPKMVKGVYGAFYPGEWIGLRASIAHGKLEAYDSKIPDKGGPERSRKDRNLQFQSSLFEAYLGVELYPTVFMEQYDGLAGKIRPYVVGGIGLFRFNPKGEYYAPDGSRKWVPLQPLRLEGQGMSQYPDRKEYKLTQVEIPLGGGIKYFLKENFYVGIEVLYRKTFTDYIDDVSTSYIDNTLFASYLDAEKTAMANQLYNRENLMPGGSLTRSGVGEQRGNPEQNDAFFSSTLKIGWRLIDWNAPRNRPARQLNCPSFF